MISARAIRLPPGSFDAFELFLMNLRTLGKTGISVSEISLGAWQLGGKWGSPFSPETAEAVLTTAMEQGVTFVDTADVYSDGESERAIGRFLKQHPGAFRVATKCGRRISPHVAENYTPETLRSHVEQSLERLQTDCIDLVQLHCPPTEVYYRDEIFELFDRLKDEGKIRNLGVSVEKIGEAERAITYPNVTTVQIIFNLFRQRPAETFFEKAKAAQVGIIARVPLASGLLSGKMTASTQFSSTDHRHFNREGAAFDKGETFSGVPFETGLEAAEILKTIFEGNELAAAALRWILMFDAVSVAIPGASNPGQMQANVAAGSLAAFSAEQMNKAREVYDNLIKPHVHHLW